MDKKEISLVIGASENIERYSFMAGHRLLAKGYKVKLLGKDEGNIAGEPILTGFPKFEKIHTITLYVGPKNQPQYYDYIISLKPKRVIFNPGAENKEFMELLLKKNIHAEEACTLVLLSLNAY